MTLRQLHPNLCRQASIIERPVPLRCRGYRAKQMPVHSIQFVVGQLRQLLACQSDGTVPWVRQPEIEAGQFIADKRTVKRGIVRNQRCRTDKLPNALPDIFRLRLTI